MSYQRQDFVDGVTTLTAQHLKNMEDGILTAATLEKTETHDTLCTDSNYDDTHEGFVASSQTVGSTIQWGSFSTSYMYNIPANAVVSIEPVTGGSYGFALCDTDNKVLEYTTNSASYTFQAHDSPTRFWASSSKLGLVKYTLTTTRIVTLDDEDTRITTLEGLISGGGNYWTGKTIWWCGTSIPAGGYPQIVGNMLGATMINTAVGGSMCRANVRTGDYNGANISNITSSLSMTLAEAESFITNYDTLRQLPLNSSWPETLGSSDQNRIRAGSFENKLMPYLNGTNPMPDLWIIDHSHNDWKYKNSQGQIDIALEPTRANITSGELAEDTFMTANNYANLQLYVGSLANVQPNKLDALVCSLNRNCYYGALNFIVTTILSHNPRARIMMIGNYSNAYSGETGYAPLIDAQKAWAASWCVPFCDIATCFGTSLHIIPGSKDFDTAHHSTVFTYDTDVFHIYCPDGVHPSSDNSKYALNIYAGILAEFIKAHR